MGDQFVLRWHCHEPTLMKNLPCLLDSELLTDVTISVGQQDVRAHRLVLATCSTYFLDLFQVGVCPSWCGLKIEALRYF